MSVFSKRLTGTNNRVYQAHRDYTITRMDARTHTGVIGDAATPYPSNQQVRG